MGGFMAAAAEKIAERQVENEHKRAAGVTESKTPVSENTRLAKRILAVVVAVCLLGIGSAKVANLRKEAASVFKNGVSAKYTASIANDISEAADSAIKLAGIARAALGETEDIKALMELASEILKTDDECELYDKFLTLVSKANTVYSAYEAAGEASDEAVRSMRNINSADTTVRNDGYWVYADEYENKTDGAWARLLKKVGGVDELPSK